MSVRTDVALDPLSKAVPVPTGEPGTQAYFEAFSAHRAFITPHIRPFAAYDRWNDRRVLELGCGIGADAVGFMQAGAEYTGVDISRAALRQARQWFRLAGVDGGLIHADAADLMEHVRQASFDLIYSFDSLHRMADPEAVIRQARRAIRPDGEFRLMLPASEFLGGCAGRSRVGTVGSAGRSAGSRLFPHRGAGAAACERFFRHFDHPGPHLPLRAGGLCAWGA